ncbi:MAG: prepilin-type N-terminal cleavage/methylation domain-containing protein [Firmicutes bacterium]|nr:prepilin-type N-terminal cleavage/methylation domain-containing protein [Bacillota bacterium]
MNNSKKNKKGFTLAELLIVVAIIAVLVAIAIPVFNSQLEKSREATDMANIRAAYAEIAASALTDPDVDHSAKVDLKQTKEGWQTTSGDIAGVALADVKQGEAGDVVVNKKGIVYVTYSAAADGSGTIKIGNKEVTSSFVS